MKKIIPFLMLSLLGFTEVLAQKNVKGTVVDDQGMPLPGTSVVVEGTTDGVQTDFDGVYTIDIEEGENLIFSYVGFKTQNIAIGDSSILNVTLVEDASQLNEVVVVGYGTQKVTNLSGSVEVVAGVELSRQPVFQTSQALAGLSPGITATQTSGQPGSDGASIRIRGVGTLGDGAKNDPLILVDGIQDDINGIDANDIESVSILKDASAAAIYGSRAANGVIIITTKRGKVGDIKTSYNTYVGFQEVAQKLNFLDGLGYIENINKANPGTYDDAFIEAYTASSGTDENPDTDWVDELFNQSGFQQYHRLSVSGGSEKLKGSASVSYQDQNANIDNFNFKRYNGRFNTDFKVSDKFSVNFDINFRKSEQQSPSAGLEEITRQAYRVPALFSAINSDGSWGPGWNGQNPVAAVAAGGLETDQVNYFRGKLTVNYKPIEDLSIAVTYAPQHNENIVKSFRAQYDWVDASQSGTYPNVNSLSLNNGRSFQDNFNIITTYNKLYAEDHSFKATAGYEFIKNTSSSFSASRTNFVLQDFQQLDSGDADTQLNSGSETLSGLESVFGRVNYSYKDTYSFEANVRRDASSRFSPENRSSIFPSASAAWIASNEKFLEDAKFVSFLKFRASWGQLGNQTLVDEDGNSIDFPYLSVFGVGTANPIIGDAPITGGAQSVLANSSLQWETTETSNIAVDAKFLDNRLSLTAEYYVRTTNDILLEAIIPVSTGFLPPVQNVGSVRNRGWDLALDWADQLGEDFSYGARFNISDYQNTVTDLGGLDELPPDDTIIRVGEAVNSIYGYKTDGFFQSQAEIDAAPEQFGVLAPGDIKYVDTNGDNLINEDDREVIGSSLPRLNYGLDLYADYKGFDLSVSLLGVGERDIVLQGDVAYAFFNAGKIQAWQADSWTTTNTEATYPRLTPGSTHNNWRTSEQWLFDASYLRVRNVSLGYSLPRDVLDKLEISKLRFYISGQNLLTFDNLPEGIDPTVPNFTSGGFYPVTSTFTLGLNLGF